MPSPSERADPRCHRIDGANAVAVLGPEVPRDYFQARDAQLGALDGGWLEQGMAEWSFAWEGLRVLGYKTHTDEDEPSGEAWQYMGSTSFYVEERRKSQRFHEFRHRMHPEEGQRRVLAVIAASEVQGDGE